MFWKTIISYVFHLITLAQRQRLNHGLTEQLRKAAELAFYPENRTVSDVVRNIATSLLRPYAKSDLILGPWSYQSYDEEAFRWWISQYLQPSKVRVTLSGKRGWDYIGISNPCQTWNVTPGYKVRYRTERLDKHVECFNCVPEEAESLSLHLPMPNPFMSTNFDVLPSEGDPDKVCASQYERTGMCLHGGNILGRVSWSNS